MTVSASTVKQLQRLDDSGGVLMLLEIAHPSLSATVRLVNDTRDLSAAGHTWIGLPFAVTLPNDTAKEVPRARLQMDNVGRELTGELEGLPPGAALTATLRLVHRSTPDTIEYEFVSPLSGVRVDQATVSATMGPDDLMRRPAVRIRFDPITAPALFAG